MHMRGTRKEKECGYLCYKHPKRLSACAPMQRNVKRKKEFLCRDM
jgi:hypothetical protein